MPSSPPLADAQREVNAELVKSILRAFDATDEAEGREEQLRMTAGLRERVLGMLGHDLQNPLAAIMMSASHLLGRGHLNDEDARLILRIMHSGARMQRMIADILDFTRARMGGGLQLDLRPTNLREVCGNVAEELAEGSTTEVTWSAHGDVLGWWDADRLTRLLANVTRNAIEHAHAKTRVELHAHDAGERVVVTVTNEGEPIPDVVMPVLFEPFRSGPRDHASTGNLGLGLFIAHEAVVAHGGEISAVSADGKTTFTVTLPRRRPPARPAYRTVDL